MRIEVRLFAQARERVGSGSARLDLPEVARIAEDLTALELAYPCLSELRPHLAVAVDGALARVDDALTADCELALLPPVSGG